MACECIAKINEALDEKNSVLVTAITWDGAEHILLRTEKKRRTRDGKKAVNVPAVFCPVCGVRYTEKVSA